MDNARFLNELRRYWDEIARGGPATPGDLDPELAATIRRLHALPDVPPPDPIYARQLREGLMHATTMSLSPADVATNPGANSRTSHGRRPILSAPPVSPARWAPAQLTTALLVLIVLVGSLLAFGIGRPGREPEDPAIVPAVIATPATPESVSGPVAEFLWQVSKAPDTHFIALGRPAIDPEGNLWVPDAAHGQFFIFAPDGTYLESWGAPGSGDGEFDFMCAEIPYGGLAFDATGAFYVVDSGNYRIQKFGPDRAFLTSWGSERATDGEFPPCLAGIAIDHQGRVYVSDRSWNEVSVFESDGTWLATWSTPLIPSGIAVGTDGTIWVAAYGDNSVVQFSPDGERLATWEESATGAPLFEGPNNLVVDAEGRVFVTEHDGNRVKVFSPQGELLGAWGGPGTAPGEFQEPRGVALDGQGGAYVTEWAGNRVQAFRLLPPVAPTVTSAP